MAGRRLYREYMFPDSKLSVFARYLCDLIIKDIEEFEKYGVTVEKVEELKTLVDDFKVFPTDSYIQEEYLSAVEARNNIINELQTIIKSMAMRVVLKWGKKSPKYRSLGITDLSKITVESYATRARTIHAFMTENLAELTTEGLTQTMLDNFETKIQELNSAISDASEKGSLRQEKTIERITKGNELYKLVSKYCDIGKRIWTNVNPAKYNNYLIYNNGRDI
jgi:hypothetical protein